MKLKTIDKALFLELKPLSQGEQGTVSAHIIYDVRRIRRIGFENVRDLLFDKTIDLYPFAVVVKACIAYNDENYRTVRVPVYLPLHQSVRLRQD